MTIQEAITTTIKGTNLPHIDVEIILANALKKSREFVLAHPEHQLTNFQLSTFNFQLKRRISGEPIAYLTGHKEFYGLDFVVNKHTLVPRPETEFIVEQVLDLLRSMLRSNTTIVDVGTGSGCIIVSIAKTLEKKIDSEFDSESESNSETVKYYAIDISKEALKMAKKNAKMHKLDKKIKFLHGSLLEPIIRNSKFKIENSTMIITANLPYLSKDIYNSAPVDVKKFEPKSALYSAKAGLAHYEKLLRQLKEFVAPCSMFHVLCFMEISPEQKLPLTKLIKSIFPKAKTTFSKDLAGKWRICKIEL